MAIMLWHFDVIETWSFVWAIPLFIFVTGSLYQNKLEKITFQKVIISAVWIFGIIIIFTLIASLCKIPKIYNNTLDDSISSIFNYFILINPYLGNLWYFLLYFQIIFVLIIAGKIKKSQFKRPLVGIMLFISGLSFSYIILYIFGKGITLNFISWIFLIWIGVCYYLEISEYFKKQKTSTLFNYLIISIILLSSIIFIGDSKFIMFIEKRTHDFIFPTIILQLCYFIAFFSLTEILCRHLPPKINNYIAIIGFYSLYIYIFHNFIYCKIFQPIFGYFGIPLTLIACIAIGYFLEKIKEKLMSVIVKANLIQNTSCI